MKVVAKKHLYISFVLQLRPKGVRSSKNIMLSL